MRGGYTGKILNIDLTNYDYDIEKTNSSDARYYIGAKGLGAKILFDRLPTETHPLSPDNILMFTTGPLTGTSVQTSGRGTVVTKSPQTGLFLDSHFGGFFAAEMKKAGWDIITINGKSANQIYITIKDDDVKFNDASKLNGKECLETHNWFRKTNKNFRTAVIGPAGENLVKFSSITIDGHRHAGRGGSGAVMGSKNLKGILISGTQKLSLYNEEKFKKKTKEVLNKIRENDFVPIRKKFGTPYWVKPVNDEGFIPTKNFSEGYYEHGDKIDAESMQNKIVDGSGSCFNCVIACWNKSSIKSGKYKGISLVGPEYETIALMGSNLCIRSIEEIAFLNYRCNELGFDSISLGGVLGFAVEAFENGVITKDDLGGYEIGWGKVDGLAKLMNDIAYKKGETCRILAEGVKFASEQFGKNTDEYAFHVKGLEIPGYDPRGTFGMGLAYATSDRGACHQRAWTAKAELYDPGLDRFSFEKKSEIVKDIQDERAAFFSLVLCDFAPISEEDCVDMLNLATGFNHNVKSYISAGERIWNLIRLFNIREGLDSASDTLPNIFFKKSFTKGPAKNITIPKDEFKESLLNYYKIRGWNSKGIPGKKKLKELGIEKYNNQNNNYNNKSNKKG